MHFTLLFTPVSITPLIDTEDACFDLNASRTIAKGDLKWRDALLVAHRVNSNSIKLAITFNTHIIEVLALGYFIRVCFSQLAAIFATSSATTAL